MSVRASAVSGFLVAVRWLLRRRAAGVVLVAAGGAFGLGWLLSDGTSGRRTAWVEFASLFAPLFAVGVGACAVRVVRGRRGAAPLDAAPLAPGAWVLGQGAALTAAILLAAAVILAPGGVSYFSDLKAARRIGAPVVEGAALSDHGRSWARAGDGTLAWTLPAPGSGAWDAVIRVDTAFYRGYRGDPIVFRLSAPGFSTLASVRSEAPFRIRLPEAFSGGTLRLRCTTEGVATAPIRDGARLVAATPSGGVTGWLALWWLVAAHALLLGATALAGSMIVSPAIAAFGAVTLWLVGWSSRFLADYAEAADTPSVFAAWSGSASEPAAGSAWLEGFAAVIRLVPDLRGAVVTDALGQGHLPESGLVLAATGPHLVMALGLVLVGAAIGRFTWKRRPGRIPGERGLF